MRRSLPCLLLATAVPLPAHTAPPGYHRAPETIARILETPPMPVVAVSPDHRTLAILGRENLPTVANMAKPILRLGGYRIDPATNGQAEVRIVWLNALALQDLAGGRKIPVAFPAGIRFTNASWSPDGKRVAMVVQVPGGLQLWTVTLDGKAAPWLSMSTAPFPARLTHGFPTAGA